MNSPVDLPLGEELDWKPVPRPARVSMPGSHILVRLVNAESDAAPLFSVSHPPDGDPSIWIYLPDGPYKSPVFGGSGADCLWKSPGRVGRFRGPQLA